MVSAIVVRPFDCTVIAVALVRGAIFTCFFGGIYDFFVAFVLRDMVDALAIRRSDFFVEPVELDNSDNAGNVSDFVVW